MTKSNHNYKPTKPANLEKITLRAFRQSAPKPGTWVSLRTWVDAANLIARLKLDGVEVTAVEGGKILRGIGLVEKHRDDGAWFAVTKAGLLALERAGDKK